MSDQEIDLSGDGGVKKKLLQEGKGDETAPDGCIVSLHYTGKLLDGTVFDSSIDRGEPFEFVLGRGSVIKAFDMGVATMKKGEKCVLICAPDYAYGAAGSPPSIPPDSTLIFELEMLGWKGEDVSPQKDGSIEKFTVTKSKTRKTPEEWASVKIHLVGKYDDKVFEERDVEFDIGEGSEHGIVEGIEIALLKIKVGETARLVIKPKYAFGEKGNESLNIPPNATVEYIVTLNDSVLTAQAWREEECLALANTLKEKGTNYLKQQKYQLALKTYKRATDAISSYDKLDDFKPVKLAMHLNSALCQQKLGEHYEAVSACNAALELDPNNIKGLYRRGQSFLAVSNFEKALVDFQKVRELEPSNKAAINQIAICKQKIKEFHEKEKRVYANMFSKFAAVDKQKETEDREAEPDVLASCGEWTEEDAKREADMAFEQHGDNIVMIDSNEFK